LAVVCALGPAAVAGGDPVLPEGCAAKAGQAINVVASSAAVKFLNMVFSVFV
jgi:hypothetical protein